MRMSSHPLGAGSLRGLLDLSRKRAQTTKEKPGKRFSSGLSLILSLSWLYTTKVVYFVELWNSKAGAAQRGLLSRAPVSTALSCSLVVPGALGSGSRQSLAQPWAPLVPSRRGSAGGPDYLSLMSSVTVQTRETPSPPGASSRPSCPARPQAAITCFLSLPARV